MQSDDDKTRESEPWSLLQFCQKEWHVVKGAPKSFFGLLAIAIGAVIFVIWVAMEWRYAGQLENKAAENASLAAHIVLLEGRIAQKDDYIKELESGTADAGVRDDQALYQGGVVVASVLNARFDAKNQILKFPVITASRELNMARRFEFQDWIIVCSGNPTGRMSFGAMQQINYRNVVCHITGKR